jgi:4'-phosphopantetheinyl transferase
MKIFWLEESTTDVPPDNEWLSLEEVARLNRLHYPKRWTDWRLGRWTAKHAVAACLNLPCDSEALAAIEIRPAESGVPEAFIANQRAAVSISLSHRGGVAACAVAPSGTMLGCDLELIESRSAAFLADFFVANEQNLVARASYDDRDRLANLIWSAKECALKALGEGLRLDPRSVTVLSGEDGSNHHPIEFGAVRDASQSSAWQPMRVAHTSGLVFHGWWQHSGFLLRTVVACPKPEEPASLRTAVA